MYVDVRNVQDLAQSDNMLNAIPQMDLLHYYGKMGITPGFFMLTTPDTSARIMWSM